MSEPVNSLHLRAPGRFRSNSQSNHAERARAPREVRGDTVTADSHARTSEPNAQSTHTLDRRCQPSDGEMYRLALELSREETKRERYRAVVALINGTKAGEPIDVAKIVAWLGA